MKRLDLIGQNFGRLKVVEYVKYDGKHTYWKCLCSCGNEKIATTTNLHQKHTKSCGCLRTELLIKRSKGRKPASTKELGESSFNTVYYRYKYQAKRKNREFSLTKEEFKKLTQGLCDYCGQHPITSFKGHRSNGEYIYNGIDRIDSNLGYTYSNSKTCCEKCNRMKLDLSLQEFRDQIRNIYCWLFD